VVTKIHSRNHQMSPIKKTLRKI